MKESINPVLKLNRTLLMVAIASTIFAGGGTAIAISGYISHNSSRFSLGLVIFWIVFMFFLDTYRRYSNGFKMLTKQIDGLCEDINKAKKAMNGNRNIS